MPDLPLAVRKWGNGTPLALLVHGITSDSGGWWRVGPALADLGYTVVAADLRGHGSSPPAPSYRLEDYAADVLALGTTAWEMVIGHSLGGATVLAAADAAPTWTDRLVLIDPWLVNDGSPPPDPDEYGAVETKGEIARKNPRWAAEDVAAKAAASPMVDRALIAQTFAETWDLTAQLDGLTMPTLLLAADPRMGAITTQAMGERAAAANAHVRFETIHGAGHSMHRDSWDEFWTLLSDFAGR
jgi:pimeloyl-ACP methyl ester carboxylesterase